MVLYAYDAAYAPNLASIKSSSGIAMNCYVSGTYAVDATWVNKIRAAGLGAWPNYERGLWELMQSANDYVAGQQAAQVGIADAIRCGFPKNGTIWFPFSVDVNVDPTRYNEVGSAFDGINNVNAGRYLISFYGQGGLGHYLRATNRIKEKIWLSSSYGFPGYNRDSAEVCIYQLIGDGSDPFGERHPTVPSTDTNIITDVKALKAWWPNGSPYGGSNMTGFGFKTQAQADEIYTAIHQHADEWGYNLVRFINSPGDTTAVYLVIGHYLLWLDPLTFSWMSGGPVGAVYHSHDIRSALWKLPIWPGTKDPRGTLTPDPFKTDLSPVVDALLTSDQVEQAVKDAGITLTAEQLTSLAQQLAPLVATAPRPFTVTLSGDATPKDATP